METGKISALQMAMLLYPTIIATAILTVPSIIARYAGNDIWISPVFSSFIGFLTVFIAVRLHRHYPTKTIIQLSEDILGKILGKVLGFLILFFYIEITGNITKNYSEFIANSFLTETPQIIIIISMMSLCAFCVHAGLEVLARSAQFLFPLFVFPLLLAIMLLYKNFDFGNFLPILENGIMPSIYGAYAPAGWFAEIFLITFLLPFLTNKDKNKGMKYGMFVIASVAITIILICLITLLVLGVATPNKTFPLMNAMRIASLGGFFENIEAGVLAIWITGAFVKMCLFYYIIALGIAQWLNLSSYRPIVWPLGIIIVQFSYWGLSNTMTLNRSDSIDFPAYSIFMQTLIPLLLLIISAIKKQK